jgi:hypothetical protein
VLVDCSATVSYTVAGVSYRSEPSLTFLSFGGYPRASVVRSASNPDLATLDIALDQLNMGRPPCAASSARANACAPFLPTTNGSSLRITFCVLRVRPPSS